MSLCSLSCDFLRRGSVEVFCGTATSLSTDDRIDVAW